MWQSLWPGCYLPLVWRQVDVNPLPFRVHVEIDKRKLVPVESVVHLQFRIRMKMIEMGVVFNTLKENVASGSESPPSP